MTLILLIISQLFNFMTVERGLPVHNTDSIAIFTHGQDKFDALFRDIDNAQKYVWMEYFIFANDSLGFATLEHLHQAALRGVEVRFIFDGYKDVERSYKFRYQMDSIRALGIDVQQFDPFKFPYGNHMCRDHRKIVCIDDTIGYFGGFNVSDYYLYGEEKYGGWRDCHVRITGESVAGLAMFFHQSYQRAGGKGKFHHNPRPFDIENPHKPAARPIKTVFFERSRADKLKKSETRDVLAEALDAATDTIRIVSPYLLPTHKLKNALNRAVKRGVHVEIMFSKKGDEPTLSYGNYHYARKLAHWGAHIYLYNGEFHHSKIMMIDNEVSMVGSANFNSRSTHWDYEVSAMFFDKEVTRRLTKVFNEDKEHCDMFTDELYHTEKTRKFRFMGWFTYHFLRPWL